MTRPYSQACENNKDPILHHLTRLLANCERVLEVGSGTGQHAEYFARHLPHITWQSSERADSLAGLQTRISQAALPNLPAPLEFDVTREQQPATRYDALFTANTLHIMRWSAIERLFRLLPGLLTARGCVCIYGPFNYAGGYTSASNELFDQSLRSRDALMGIRDIEKIQQLAQQYGLSHLHDYQMPANNRLLFFTPGPES